jgi:hypothetical protein
MKKTTTALFVILLFVFSCTKESVSPDLDSGYDVLKKAEAAKKVTKTLKFHESSGILLYFADPPVPCEICDICEYGSMLLVQGTGHATHLGAFTVINYLCYEDLKTTRGILTAANGDHLFTMVIGTSIDEDLGLIYHYAILEGDGRFEGATGWIDMWGDIDDIAGTFDLEGEGEVTY